MTLHHSVTNFEFIVQEENPAKLQEFIKDLNDELDKVIDSIHYEPVDFVLHPTEAQEKFIEHIKKEAKERGLNKEDLMQLAKSDIISFGVCILALDAFEGVDDEVLEEAFRQEAITPLIKEADKILKIPTVRMSPTEFYNKVLAYRNKERDEDIIDIRNDPMIFGLIGKIEGKTFSNIKKDLEEKHPLEIQTYITTRLQNAKLDSNAIDMTEFLDYAIEHMPNHLIHFIPNIEGLDQRQKEEIIQRADNVLSNLEQIPTPLPKTIIQEKFQHLTQGKKLELIENLISLGRYSAIEVLLSSLDVKSFTPERKLLVKGIKLRLLEAKKEQNHEDALQMTEVLKKIGVANKGPKNLEIKQSRLIEEHEFSKRKVTQEAAKFYLYEWANYQLMLLKQGHKIDVNEKGNLAKEPREFSNISDRVKLAEIENTVSTERNALVEDMFEWMRRYAVVAVNSEIKYQTQKDRFSGDYVRPVDIIENKTLTNENIRVYLAKAAYLFPIIQMEMFKWNPNEAKNIAGDLWATVAKVTKRAWIENDLEIAQKIVLIDQFFDLEHNTGHIFDKDYQLVIGQHLTSFLDLKFKTSNPHELINFIRNSQILAESDIKHFENIFQNIAELKNAPIRAASYE